MGISYSLAKATSRALKMAPGATAAPLTRGVGGLHVSPGGPRAHPVDARLRGTMGTHKGCSYDGRGVAQAMFMVMNK